MAKEQLSKDIAYRKRENSCHIINSKYIKNAKIKNKAEKLINKWHNEISSSSHKINVN